MAENVCIEYSKGNLKVGKDTMIMNITSATDCPSYKLGLCKIPDGKCYAMRAENPGFRPKVLPYRRRQTRVWDALSPEELAQQIKSEVTGHHRRKVPLKYLRMQEAGDFRDQGDVDKLVKLAKLLDGTVKVYVYTARRDLNIPKNVQNLVINGSGFMADNEFRAVSPEEYAYCPKGRPPTFDCNKCESKCKSPRCRGIRKTDLQPGGGCLGCTLCKEPRGYIIREVLSGGPKRLKKVTYSSGTGGHSRKISNIPAGIGTGL